MAVRVQVVQGSGETEYVLTQYVAAPGQRLEIPLQPIVPLDGQMTTGYVTIVVDVEAEPVPEPMHDSHVHDLQVFCPDCNRSWKVRDVDDPLDD